MSGGASMGVRRGRFVRLVPRDRRVLAFGEACQVCWAVVRGVARVRPYRTEVMRQATILVTGSAVVVLAMVFSYGLLNGVLSSYFARLVGAPAAAGAIVAVGGLREMTALAFGFMMAAKVSTGYVAEIGTMRIADEVDAVDVMGLDSLVYLGSTRLLATWLALPCLYGLAIAVGFLGGFLAVVVQIGEVSQGGYLELFWKFQNPLDLLFSFLKGMAMGTFVVLVGIYYGWKVRGGPVEVGQAAARSMVVNVVGIAVVMILGTQLFWGGAPNLPIGG